MSSRKPVQVEFICGSYPPIKDGVGFYMQCLGQYLRNDYKVITSVGGEKTKNTWPIVKSWRMGVASVVAAVIQHDQPDILHMQYPSIKFGRSMGSTLLPRKLINKFPATPFVITVHEYHDASWLGRKRVEIMLKPVANIIVSNAADKKLLSAKFPQKSFYQIPIGSNISVEKFSAKEIQAFKAKYNPHDKKTVLNWGLLDSNKGVDKLVEAIGSVGTNVKLLIASGYNANDKFHQTLKRQIDNSKADIDWLGFLDDRQISGLLQISDLVVLPFNQAVSLRRGSMLASLLHGKPVITTGPSEDPELINKQNCYLLDDNSAPNIEAAIKHLLDDQKLAKLVADGATKLAQQFDWKKIAESHEVLYEKLLSRH